MLSDLKLLLILVAKADIAGARVVVVDPEMLKHLHRKQNLTPAIAESFLPLNLGVGHHLFVVQTRRGVVDINLAENSYRRVEFP